MPDESQAAQNEQATADQAAVAAMKDGEVVPLSEPPNIKIPETPTKATEPPTLSDMAATKGRVVLVHHKRFRFGPYPALVVQGSTPGVQSYVNVRVLVDEANEPDWVKLCADSQLGETMTSVPLFDPLTDAQRNYVRDSGSPGWAEWMPYQAGQAKRTDAAEGGLKAELDALKAAFIKLCNITGECNGHVNAKQLAASLE